MQEPFDPTASIGQDTGPLVRNLDERLQTVGAYYDKATHRFQFLRSRRTANSDHLDTRGQANGRLSDSGRHRLHDVTSLTELATVEAVLDNVKDAILTLDDQGRVLTCNSAGLRVFGYSPDEMERLTIEALLPYKTRPKAYLDRLSQRADDTIVDLASQEVEARRRDGDHFKAEIAVSRLVVQGEGMYILCLRDITERYRSEQALKESEARYRALVENSTEVILVLDVDRGRFVDANENAASFFRMAREELLALGPEDVSASLQPDGMPSFGIERGYVSRALNGGSPVFEWLHRDAEGRELPCEVRFTRLPSSRRRLIRASLIDISSRKRAEVMAHAERQVLELIAANAPLERTLAAICRALERFDQGVGCAVMLLEDDPTRLRVGAAPTLPGAFRAALECTEVGLRAGSAAAAASMGRQVIVQDISTDVTWRELASLATSAGLRACCATPIITAGQRLQGTLDVYFADHRSPRTEELDAIARFAQLAGIAIERREDEHALRSSEARWRELFENVVDGVYQTSPSGEILAANPALVTMLGYSSEAELREAGRAQDFHVHPGERDASVRAMERDGVIRNQELHLCRRDGREIVVLENGRAVRDAEGRLLHYEGTLTDISERKLSEMAVFEEKERLLVTLKSIGDAVITTDASGAVTDLNPAAEELIGWEARVARGRPIDEVLTIVDAIERSDIENPVRRCLREGRKVRLPEHAVLVGRNGVDVNVQDSAAPIRDREGHVIGAVMVFHDVSKEERLQRQLNYQSSHDPLTGLINRTEFEGRLASSLDEVRRHPERMHALLYLDLDQFKVINDTAGHVAGDHLLKQVTEVLLSRVRTSDVLARIGGDEFALLLQDCPARKALQVADDLREAILEHRFCWKERSMSISASIGVVSVTTASPSAEEVFSLADVACYAAKDEGRNRIHLCEEGDVPEKHKEMQWVSRISHAVEDERLELYFQPIIAIGGNPDRGGHYELLLRMRDEHGKLVPPSEFIPAAERYNLMPMLDRWVVREAMERLVCRSTQYPYTLSVNLSGTSLSDTKFLSYVVSEFERLKPPAGAICFEITETAAISNLVHVAHFMNELKRLGAKFSLDDFGSGLSSFTYLKTLPVDFLKIDGQFIKNVVRDRIDQSMVDAINKVGLAMGIQTIAERVESGEVLQRLAELGVAYAQGYHIAVPQPVAELPASEALRQSA
ncbi:MAG: PAS domain S-box protein [Gammaproteobacteria bacterium]|nr:PAS domain S-box protein [Gammaproteobacteria bacterium]